MNTIIHNDCCEALSAMQAESIHLVVTSPPYDQLRTCYANDFNFERLAVELTRVLVPGGIICWNVNDSTTGGSETLTSCKQKIFFHEQCGLRIHDTMIYEKNNFGHPERARYHSLFEYVFILSKGKPRCFNPIKDKKNTWAGTGTWGRNSVREANGDMGLRTRNIISEYGMRGNVWKGKTSGQERGTSGSIHPAKMPDWLARDLIVSWSNVGDVVLDPMCGSGTTLCQAKKLNRCWIGIDNDIASVQISHEQISKIPLTA